MTSYNWEATSQACRRLNIFSPLYPQGRYRWRRSHHQTWPHRTSGRWSAWPWSCSSAGSCVWKSPSGPVRWRLGTLASSSKHREQQSARCMTNTTASFHTGAYWCNFNYLWIKCSFFLYDSISSIIFSQL